MPEIDNKAIIAKMIQLCWVCLFVCIAIKVLGGDYFNIVVTNQRFIDICNMVDNNIVILRILQFIVFFSTSYLYFNSILYGKTSAKFNLLYIVLYAIKFIDLTFAAIIDSICMILLPLLYKVPFHISMVHYFGIVIMQCFSMYIRSLSNVYLPDNALIGLIMNIDYYIMLILLYLNVRLEAN